MKELEMVEGNPYKEAVDAFKKDVASKLHLPVDEVKLACLTFTFVYEHEDVKLKWELKAEADGYNDED